MTVQFNALHLRRLFSLLTLDEYGSVPIRAQLDFCSQMEVWWEILSFGVNDLKAAGHSSQSSAGSSLPQGHRLEGTQRAMGSGEMK